MRIPVRTSSRCDRHSLHFIFARKAFNQTAAFAARLDVMENLASSATRQADAAPLLPSHERRSPNHRSGPAQIETTEEGVASTAVNRAPSSDGPTFLLPHPVPPGPGFEDVRQPAVWVLVGGLPLGARRFFMAAIRSTRTARAGVRTLAWRRVYAPVAACIGEWTRRKESISAIEALPIRHIPAIRTLPAAALDIIRFRDRLRRLRA